MDIRSLVTLAVLITTSISSAVLSPLSFADDMDSEDKFWINRTHKNLSKVDNFQAITEKTLSHKNIPVISDVIFQKPADFYSIITQPESVKGFEASYSNNTITLHDNINKQALRIKGLEKPKESAYFQRVKGIYFYNKEHYDQEFTPSIHVADRLSVGIDFTAKEKNLDINKIEGFVDYHYSLFMQANFIFNNGVESKIKNTHIEFNKDSLSLPVVNLPKNTQITSWDFSKKHFSNKQLSEKVSQKIIWPQDKDNTWNFSTKKYYPQENPEHAAAYYYNEAFFLITVTEPHNGNELSSLGVPIALTDTQAKLNQFAAFSSLEFNDNGIHYTLLSNIHPQSLLSMAKGMVKNNE